MIHTPVGADRSSLRNWSAPTVVHATMSPCRAIPPASSDLRAALMGRHDTPGPGRAAPARTRLGRFLVRWLERIGIGLVAGAGTLGVLLWAGTSWTASLWIAGRSP